MNKIIRITMMAVVALFMSSSMQAKTVKIDFNANGLKMFEGITAVSSMTSHDGDITETKTATVDGVTITVSPKVEGQATENRMWGQNTQLRMYSGTLKLSASEKITKIKFTTGTFKGVSASIGTLDDKTWTYKEDTTKEVTFTVESKSGNQMQVNSIELTVGEDAKPDAPVVTTGEGTEAKPYTVEDANKILNAGKETSSQVFVSGTISKIKEVSTKYGNSTFFISDDGTETNQFEVFRANYLKDEKFTAENQIKVGDKVVIKGVLVTYGTTKEINKGYIYSLNGATTAINSIHAASNDNAPIYNLAGQRVGKSYKGVVIKNGKKFLQK